MTTLWILSPACNFTKLAMSPPQQRLFKAADLFKFTMAGIFMIISDILSVIAISICFVIKIPQIIRLYQAKNANSLSLIGLFLELSSYTITMLYNYINQHALILYMEYPIIITQEFIIILIVLHYRTHNPLVFLLVLAISLSTMFAFAVGIFSKVILTLLVPFTIPCGSLGKIMQLKVILRNKDSSSVSALTWFFSCLINTIRIYTIYLDSADINLLLNFTISSVLCWTVLAATLHYRVVNVSASDKDK